MWGMVLFQGAAATAGSEICLPEWARLVGAVGLMGRWLGPLSVCRPSSQRELVTAVCVWGRVTLARWLAESYSATVAGSCKNRTFVLMPATWVVRRRGGVSPPAASGCADGLSPRPKPLPGAGYRGSEYLWHRLRGCADRRSFVRC